MVKRSVLSLICLAGAAALPLGGCTDLRRAIGMEKVIPDEYSVVSRAPLAIPPDYGLRPPRPGARPTQEASTTDLAKKTVFRVGEQQASLPPPASSMSPGEGALLKKAGATEIDANIRDEVNQENLDAPEVDKGFVDTLLFWRSDKAADKSTIIDPQKEAQRLKEQQVGKGDQPGAKPAAATAAASVPAPTIERKSSSSLLDSLF